HRQEGDQEEGREESSEEDRKKERKEKGRLTRRPFSAGFGAARFQHIVDQGDGLSDGGCAVPVDTFRVKWAPVHVKKTRQTKTNIRRCCSAARPGRSRCGPEP